MSTSSSDQLMIFIANPVSQHGEWLVNLSVRRKKPGRRKPFLEGVLEIVESLHQRVKCELIAFHIRSTVHKETVCITDQSE